MLFTAIQHSIIYFPRQKAICTSSNPSIYKSHYVNKRKKAYPKCPSCKIPRHPTEMKEALTENEKIDASSDFMDGSFDWACDLCLSSKKAIKANPGLQNYCWSPHYAYFNSHLICRNCDTPFIFSIKEKQFWFEEIKFWIDSAPVNCLNCRKEIRLLKKENKTLSDILSKKEDAISVDELKKVIQIYAKWQKEERAKYYQSVLKKRKK